MRGGWRYGAGRPARHAKTSSTLRLDVRRLARQGWLERRGYIRLEWPSGACIDLEVSAESLTLHYRFRFSEGWRDITQPVDLIRTPCHYGGERRWFRCPYCHARAAILYLRGWPGCRKCKHLVYESQSQDAIDRSWLRTERIMDRLGQIKEGPHAIPKRPKGMRKATFGRLWERWCREERYRDEAIEVFAARLLPLGL